MIALQGMGGWADKLAGQFFDARQHRKVIGAATPEEAVALAFREAKRKRQV